MFKISTYISNELKDSKVILRKLELNVRNEVLEIIIKKYIDSTKKGACLWEKFKQYESVNDDMAWNWIREFIKDNSCIMFFNQEDDKEMFVLQSGYDLNYVLSETYGFEFYVTDIKGTYLICFNHHNILYGCGCAEEWVKNCRCKKIV